jgi:tetratricopeptide (TPR) repeat protein
MECDTNIEQLEPHMNTSQKFLAFVIAISSCGAFASTASADEASSKSVSVYVAGASASQDMQLRAAVLAKFQSGDLQGARALIEKALAANPQNAEAYLCQAIVLYAEHKGNQSVLEALSKAIALDPEFLDAIQGRGYLLEQMNDYVAAIKDFDTVLAIDPKNKEILDERIKLHKVMQDYPGLIADLTLMISNDPNDASAYYYRGLIYEKMGDKVKALADLQTAERMFVAQGEKQGAQQAKEEIATLQKAA